MTAGECSSASLAWSRPILNFLTYLIGKNLNDFNLGGKNIERSVEKKCRDECTLRYRVGATPMWLLRSGTRARPYGFFWVSGFSSV